MNAIKLNHFIGRMLLYTTLTSISIWTYMLSTDIKACGQYGFWVALILSILSVVVFLIYTVYIDIKYTNNCYYSNNRINPNDLFNNIPDYSEVDAVIGLISSGLFITSTFNEWDLGISWILFSVSIISTVRLVFNRFLLK